MIMKNLTTDTQPGGTKRRAGFTLIELVVTLFIGAAFLFTLAIIFGRGIDSVRTNINTIRTYDNARIAIDSIQKDIVGSTLRQFDVTSQIYRLRGASVSTEDDSGTTHYFDQIEFWVNKFDQQLQRDTLHCIRYCVGRPSTPGGPLTIVTARQDLSDLRNNGSMWKYEGRSSLSGNPAAMAEAFEPLADNIISLEIKYLSFQQYNVLSRNGALGSIDWDALAPSQFRRSWDTTNSRPPILNSLPAAIYFKIGVRYNFDPRFDNPASIDPRQYIRYFETTVFLPNTRANV